MKPDNFEDVCSKLSLHSGGPYSPQTVRRLMEISWTGGRAEAMHEATRMVATFALFMSAVGLAIAAYFLLRG